MSSNMEKLRYTLIDEQYPHFYEQGEINKQADIDRLKTLTVVTRGQESAAKNIIYDMLAKHLKTNHNHRAKYEVCYTRTPLLEHENRYPPSADTDFVMYASAPHTAKTTRDGGIYTSIMLYNPGDAIKMIQALDAHSLKLHVSYGCPPTLMLSKCDKHKYMAIYGNWEDQCSCSEYDSIMIPNPVQHPHHPTNINNI